MIPEACPEGTVELTLNIGSAAKMSKHQRRVSTPVQRAKILAGRRWLRDEIFGLAS
jgi:hypothetical protein